MSRGRIARANRRYPDARRRAARYGGSPRGRRAVGLPPHLLPGVSGRGKKATRTAAFVAAGAGLALVALIVFTATLVVSTAGAVGGTVHAYREVNKDLPNAAQVAVDTFETTTLFDRNGVKLQEVDQVDGGWRTFVPLNQVGRYAIDATVAAEDATFWSHYGVEPIAILRGAFINFSGSGSSGGSTITQQLARGLYPDQIGNDLTVTRKFKEAMAAVAIDKEFAKQDILTMYLNQVFYGQRSYGIEAAANTYFEKDAKDLTLAEASMLAGLPQAPSYYDPTVRFDQAKIRQKYVLDQMVKNDYVTQEDADKAYKARLNPKTRNGAVLHAPHFTQYVKDYIEQKWPGALYGGGLDITTSIDVELQERAEELVRQGVNENVGYSRNNAAMVAMVPWSGQILAMVGSADFDDPFIGGQVNYALAKRQPGSSMKPIVYAAAFESGWNPGTVVMDIRISEPVGPGQPNYEPNNYNGQFNGAVSVRTALANSLNIPAVKAIEYAGIQHVMDLSKRMGIETSLDRPYYDYGLSLGLGSGEVRLLEHTNAYATLANNGTYVPANPILKVEDSQGNVLYDVERDKPWEQATQGLKAEYAYQITSIMTDNKARELIFGPVNLFGETGKALNRPVAAKSGTTEGWRDIWTMGYTTDLAVGVWMGNTSADGSSFGDLPELDGIEGAGPIWRNMMLEMHQDGRWSKLLRGPNGREISRNFPRPEGIYDGTICEATGHKATGGFSTRKEVLVRGEGPALACDQLSAWEAAELRDALADVRSNGRYAAGGADRIRRYSDAANGVRGGGSGSGSGSSSGFDDDDSGGNSPPIEPVDD